MLVRSQLVFSSLLLASVALGSACSTVVPDEFARVRCSAEGQVGPPACEAGEVCGAGVCTTCAEREACGDGVDNDCNGQVDDGCDSGGADSRCCSSRDCAPQLACAHAVRGAGELLKLCVESEAFGPTPVGEPCGKASECRTGSCIDEHCSDACCSDDDCPLSLPHCESLEERGVLVLRCVAP